VELLRGQQGKAVTEREARLGAENGIGSRASAVALEFSLFENEPQQIVVLNHARILRFSSLHGEKFRAAE
jgi:hypothetical protein